ncbi:MAG: hypothetical protein Q9160_006591 [Pyrenula sp. 1 TL-2023]
MSAHSSEENFEGSPSPAPGSESRESATVCFLCRQRKTKCDRKKTGCSNCKAKGVRCQYIPTPRRHGLRAGYVSELERRIDTLEQEVSQFKSGSLQGPSHPSAIDTLLAAASSNEISVGPLALDTLDHVPAEISTEVVIHNSPEQPQSPRYHGPALGVAFAVSDQPQVEEDFLTPASLSTWVQAWFMEYHTCIPILRKEDVLLSLDNMAPAAPMDDIVLKSIVAITVSHARQVIALGYEGRRSLGNRLRQEVIMEAMSKTSLKALQALCIILVFDYGYGRINEFWSLMAIAKGMVLQLDLKSYVDSDHEQALSSQEREDILLATWACRTLANAANPSRCWADNDDTPYNDAMIFANQNPLQHVLHATVTSEDEAPNAYADFVKLVSYSLSPIRQPISREIQLMDPLQRIKSERASCESVFAAVMRLTEDCAPLNSPLESYKTDRLGCIFFDPNVVMTRAAFHAAIVNYVGQFIWAPIDNTASNDAEPWQDGLSRCLTSTKYIAQMIKELSDWDIEFISPVFIQFIFIAARFFLVYSRNMAAHRTIDFDLLMHTINMCGRRWPLARRLDIVLRTIVAEERFAESSVPPDFFNLRISAPQLHETLKQFVESLSFPRSQGAFNLAGISGPYT